MDPEEERGYLLKAINAFRRKFVVVNPDFEILAASDHVKEVFGKGIAGRYCYEAFHNRTKPCDMCAVQIVLDTGQPSLSPQDVWAVDNEYIPCYYAYPIYDNGKTEALVSMDFDLPGIKELYSTMHKTNAFLKNLLFSAVDGVIAADKKGNILLYNDAAEDVFGYTKEEALNHLKIWDIYPDRVANQIMEMLRSEEYGGKGKLRGYQVNILTKNKKTVPISLNAAIIYEKDQEIATIGFFHDLREELKIKQNLERTRIQLLQSEKMASLGKMAAGVAHQINNPLGGITLYAKLILEEYDIDDGLRSDLMRILKDANRCKETVKELLEFSRQTRYLMRPCDINRAISRTLFLLENQSLFQNIEIKRQLLPSLPRVNADSQQINHLFMNLILNAAQAMEGKGRLTITTSYIPDTESVRIEIKDTGRGIPEAIRERIFEPFFTTKQEGEGTGLGLSLAYSIVENHNGNIRAESTEGKGTSFIITLPVLQQGKGDVSESGV